MREKRIPNLLLALVLLLALALPAGAAEQAATPEDTDAAGVTAAQVCTHANTAVEGAKPATCTEEGYTGDVVCQDCGETVAQGETILPTGHQYTDQVAVVEPTCTEPGGLQKTCDICGFTEFEADPEQPALGHSWGEWTDQGDGTHIRSCTRAGCGETETEAHTIQDGVCVQCGFALRSLEEGGTLKLAQTSFTCDGKAKTPAVTVCYGNETLTEGTDYTVTYAGNLNGGTATVTVTGQGLYCGSLTAHFQMRLSTPQLSGAVNAETGIQVTWKQVAGASGYRVYRRTGSSTKWERIANVTANSYTDTGVKSGTRYTYTVRAYCGTLEEAESHAYQTPWWSGYVSAGVARIHLAAPKLIRIAQSETGVSLAWTGAADSTGGYRIYRKTADSGWKALKTVGYKVNSYVDGTAVSGTTYYYTVRAYRGGSAVAQAGAQNNDNWSGYRINGVGIPYLAAPKLTAIANRDGGVGLSWEAPAGASGFRVFRRTGSGSWRSLADVSGKTLSYLDTTAEANVSYTYTVRPYQGSYATAKTKAYSCAYWGAYSSAGITITYLPTPALSKIANQNGGVSLSWTSVKGATGYYVYRRNTGGKWAALGVCAGTTYLDKTAVSGNSYDYTVRAVQGKTISDYKRAGISVHYLATPALGETSGKNGGAYVCWSGVPGATSYRLYRKTSGGSWALLVRTAKTEYTDTTVSPDTCYWYTVRAENAKGISSYIAAGTMYSGIKPVSYNFSTSYRSGVYYQRLMSASLGSGQRANLLAIARSQVGYTEGNSINSLDGSAGGSGNYTEFGRWYYYNVDSSDVFYKGAWCSMFASWCANEAGISTSIVPRRALVAYMKDAFSAQGRYYTWSQSKCGGGSRTIQPGDFIIYSATPAGRYNHIGIVSSVVYSGSRVTINTVEGNVDDTCVTRRWTISTGSGGRIDSSHYIRGFCCPNYSS